MTPAARQIVFRTLALAALCLSGALSGCTFAAGRGSVLVTSTPPGAEIYLDGVDTGTTTPAMIDVASVLGFGGFLGSESAVTIRKDGFEPEKRTLYHHSSFYTSKWSDGATTFWMFTAPLFWTFGDFFLPFGARWTYSPHEVHVKLYPEGEAPGR